ncbi:MAG: hypothetical protein SGPRY_006333 [Prymnesium sp.]
MSGGGQHDDEKGGEAGGQPNAEEEQQQHKGGVGKKKAKKPRLTPAEAEAAGRAAAKARAEVEAREKEAAKAKARAASAPPSPKRGGRPSSGPLNTTLTVGKGDVELGGSIAEGEFAEVFRGLLWGQRVAVKQLKSKDFSPEDLLSELRHEVSVMASLRHPNVRRPPHAHACTHLPRLPSLALRSPPLTAIPSRPIPSLLSPHLPLPLPDLPHRAFTSLALHSPL